LGRILDCDSERKPTQKQATPQSTSVGEGEYGILRNPYGKELVLIALTEQAYKEWMHAESVGDKYGIANLGVSGQLVWAKDGTAVLVIDRAYNRRKVRILSGEQTGFAGWLPKDCVRRE
jgi:hypothetical protein